MTKQQLEYFLSAVEFCNLSKAAGFHYVSIPTLTRHINDLETELSTKLFNRNNRGLTLTAAGALFHSVARDTLLQMYQYYMTILEKGLLVGEPHDEFIMGYYPFGGMFPAYSKLIEKYLNLWIKKPCILHCVQTGKMTEMVRTGQLNVGAVSASRLERFGDEFQSRTFFTSHARLLVSDDHELANRDSITIDEIIRQYGDYGLYLPEDMADVSIREKTIVGKDSIMELCRIFLNHLPSWSASVYKNNGYLANTMLFMTSDIQRPEITNLHTLNIEGVDLSMCVKLFWRRDDDSPVIQRFQEALDFAEIK